MNKLFPNIFLRKKRKGIAGRDMVRGQVIILTILILGGTLLGTASVAALLLVYQIRQSTDFSNSGKAIFAADSGIEWFLYNRANPGASKFFTSSDNKTWKATLTNCESGGCPTATVSCFNGGTLMPDCADPGVNSVRSVGISNETSRAFQLNL